MTDSDKHSSLLRYELNTVGKGCITLIKVGEKSTEGTDSDKHSCSLRFEVSYDLSKIYSTGP